MLAAHHRYALVVDGLTVYLGGGESSVHGSSIASSRSRAGGRPKSSLSGRDIGCWHSRLLGGLDACVNCSSGLPGGSRARRVSAAWVCQGPCWCWSAASAVAILTLRLKLLSDLCPLPVLCNSSKGVVRMHGNNGNNEKLGAARMHGNNVRSLYECCGSRPKNEALLACCASSGGWVCTRQGWMRVCWHGASAMRWHSQAQVHLVELAQVTNTADEGLEAQNDCRQHESQWRDMAGALRGWGRVSDHKSCSG
jgi:hypothetical protein